LSSIFKIEKRDYITQQNNINMRHTCFVISSCRVLAFCSSSSCETQIWSYKFNQLLFNKSNFYS